MRGKRSKDNCYLWIPKVESKICEACQLMSQLKQSHQVNSKAGELVMDPVRDIQDKNEDREESSHILVDNKFFDRDRYVLDNVYQRLQRRTNKMRTLSLQPKNINGLWTCMNRPDKDSADDRNKVLIVSKTEAAEDIFVVTQKYQDDMSSKMLEHEECNLKIAGSQDTQQWYEEEWADIADGRNLKSIGWFNFNESSTP
jgi:hypothetical protein